MTTKRLKSSDTNSTPVDILMTVTKFADVLGLEKEPSCRLTEYTMDLKRTDPRVFIKGDTIFVRRPGAPLRFTLVSGRRDRNRYYPVGIAFVREGKRTLSDDLRLGFVNFPQSETRFDRQTTTILDSYKDETPGIRYKFSLLIQRGSDGRMGIIDPGIEHDASG